MVLVCSWCGFGVWLVWFWCVVLVEECLKLEKEYFLLYFDHVEGIQKLAYVVFDSVPARGY